MGEPLVIPVAHDFICPWCWIGLFQARRLQAEFGIQIEWRSHELMPEELEWPERAPTPPIPNKPPTLSRFEFLELMDGVVVPPVDRPKRMRDHNAHEAVEFFKVRYPEKVDSFVETLYRAYWERGERIGDLDVVLNLAKPLLGNEVEAMQSAIEERQYKDRIVPFDAPSYRVGVFNVPTFTIGGRHYAEQPYVVLRRAMEEVLGTPIEEIYSALSFPPPPAGRPYTFVNMVATIDGKIVTGARDEPVVDLGSQNDHQLMKRIEASADAVLLGAQTLRAAKKSWNPNAGMRVVMSNSGNLDFDSCFFSGHSIVASRESLDLPEGVENITFTDVSQLLATLRQRGVQRLLVLGGSQTNAELFEQSLIDEIFLTVAPKIKLGADTPTMAGGNPLSRESIQNYSLVEQHDVGNEVFLRYRRLS